MTKKINRVVAYVLLLVAVLLIIYSNSRIRQENKRLQDNQTALMKRIQEQTLKDGTHKVEKERLLLARNELEGTNAELERELKLLKIKYSRLKQYQQTSTTAQYIIDTIEIIREDKRDNDTISSVNYVNPYINISAEIQDNRQMHNVNITTYDTITTILSKEYRKKFLFFHWRPYYKVTIHNKNPYSKITNAEYVEIK